MSLLLLKKDTVKRFIPVAIFTALLMTIYNDVADSLKWIVIKENVVPWVSTFIPFVYGAFLVATIWIFSFTYGRFLVYLLTNIVADFIFMFLVSSWYESLGLYEFVNRSRWNIFVDLALISVVIYGYQRWHEGILENRGENKEKEPLDIDVKKLFGIKGKAR